jgi:hypothetical protein
LHVNKLGEACTKQTCVLPASSSVKMDEGLSELVEPAP